ncbi:MAG: transposase [Lachnospiraceae bacterium]|nr:transposase [Lachnospiraceae bacterium]
MAECITKTLADWIIQCVQQYLQSIYRLMKEEFLHSGYTHYDETRTHVIDGPDQRSSTLN